ncbi:hypothetical protein MHB85_19260 [Paenibacillus sp. FSL K6-4396]|uniref:hypothetical protein n=1 Tax=Paenibacillus sp. FSL K6-4396 TaxID=2921506 RepID=UPI0030F6F527
MNRKEYLLQVILHFLKENPQTQTGAIHEYVRSVLHSEAPINPVEARLNIRLSTPITNEDAMLVNEIIYDLIHTRVLTPGVDRSNLDLPFISVTSEENFKTYYRPFNT